MAGSAVPMAVVIAHQMPFDIAAVNPTPYASLLRATGTLFDANVAGAAAALWTGLIIVTPASARHASLRVRCGCRCVSSTP